MKKIIASLVALAVLSGAAFADDEEKKEGLSVSGYIRAGMSDAVQDSVYSSATWMGGDYFGGSSRLRLNIDYTKDFGGATFRYQTTAKHEWDQDKDDPTDPGKLINEWKFFDEGNIKWAMGFANFADSQIIAEGGIIRDRFTRTGGWEDTGIDGGKGVRIVFAPKFVEGLTVAGQITDRDAEKYAAGDDKVKDGKAYIDDIKFNKNLFGASAKYENKAFFVTGGAQFAGYFYGSVGLTAVENLTLVGEVFVNNKKSLKDKYDDKAYTMIVGQAEYTGIEKLLVGLAVYTHIADDKYYNDENLPFISVNPAVSYDVTDLIAVSLDSTLLVPKAWDEDKVGAKKLDTFATITPAVTFKASEKATATVYGTISTKTDYKPHTVGAGVKYKF